MEGSAIDISAFLGALLLLLVTAKIGAEIAERLGQPSVLGEIVAGILVGATGLGLLVRGVGPSGEAIFQVFHLSGATAQNTYSALDALAEIGAIVLLFEIGLHTDLYELRKVGKSALWVGAAGVVLPFVGGWWAAQHLLGLPSFTALVIGAALTATSVGITARVFQDLDLLHTAESQVVLGAAVADDVIGLVILAVISALGLSQTGAGAGSQNLWILGLKVTIGAVGFLVAAVFLGVKMVPGIDMVVKSLKSRGSITVLALAFCLMMALLGEQFRLAFIIGAFAAGLVLSHCECQNAIQEGIKPLADIFIPVFFAMMGTVVNLRVLFQNGHVQWPLVTMTLVLVAVAVVGKVVGCITVPDKNLNKMIVGLAMIPRGEVGLIYARLGIGHGWLRESAYDAVVLMVILTTLMTPPLLRLTVRGRGGKTSSKAPDPTLDREDWEVFDADAMMQKPDKSPPASFIQGVEAAD